MIENKLNVDLSYGLKGSYTVEGAIIIPIFITMLAIAMKMGLVLYNEMKQDSSYEYATDMWLVWTMAISTSIRQRRRAEVTAATAVTTKTR